MRLKVPKSTAPVTRLLFQYKHNGEQCCVKCPCDISVVEYVEIDLPEGVTEDSVTVVAEFLDASASVVGSQVIQEAAPEKTPEPTETESDAKESTPIRAGRDNRQWPKK